MSGAWVWAALAAGSFLLQRVLRRRLDTALTALTLGVTLVGTFALDLLLRLPLVSAAAAFALAALALFVREQGALTTRRALVIGAAAGLAAAAHAPNAALALLALPRRGESNRPLAVALIALAGVWAGARAVGLGAPLPSGPWAPLIALFGSRQGLLHLTPALWLGMVGLAAGLRRDAREAAPLAASLAALVVLHGFCPLTADAACPREQLAAALPLLAPPMGTALRALRDAVRRAPAAPLWIAGALLVCSNLLFMQQYATDMIPRDFPVPFAQVARNQAALVAGAVGAPLSWPASWLFAAWHDTGPERFDAAAGKRLPRSPDGALTIDVGRLDVDDALLLDGWSVRHPCGAAVCRAIEGQARLLVPIEDDGPLELVVRAAGSGVLRAAGAPPLPLGAAPADLRFPLGRAQRGLRAITLNVTPESARALIDQVTVRPAAGSAP